MPPVPIGPMPHTAEIVVTMVLAVVTVIAVIVAAFIGRRDRSPYPLVVLLGAALASINEPIVDVLGGCVHWQIGQMTLFETYGRPIPLWLPMGYVVIFGVTPLVLQPLLRGPHPRRRLWQAIGLMWLVNLGMEVVIMHFGVYAYYGDQPFKFFGFPLHWLVINMVGPAAVAVTLSRIPASSDKRYGCLLLLVLPATAQLAGIVVSLPAFSLLNTDLDSVWKGVGSLASIAFGLLAIAALSRLLPAEKAPPGARSTAAESARPELARQPPQ